MSNEQIYATMSDEEIQAFAEKLETWAQGLPAKEQAALKAIFRDAVDADTDGYVEPVFVERRVQRVALTEAVLARLGDKFTPSLPTPGLSRPGEIKRVGRIESR